MRCPACDHVNQAGAKFCANCGTRLGVTCPVCSAPAQPDDRFCDNCGNPLVAEAGSEDLARYLPGGLLEKLRSARAGRAMQGERRTVTMLFADIQGSTAAAESLDPEDWAEVVNGAFEHLIGPVHRYEGTLARLQGDAVLAFFGAPIAHEDDPVRAVRAGLEIVEGFARYRSDVEERWAFPIEVRVGINTGLVVVGEVGSDLRVEYTALGDAINVAARMEQTADPGTVRVTDRTHALAGGAFEFETVGPVPVKGKADPVEAWRVTRFLGTPSLAPATPIVGRTDEVAVFDRLRSTLVGGSGWIASVIAEAGLGKTALLGEIERRADEEWSLLRTYDETRSGLTWMLSASRSYDSAVPFSSIRDLLRRWWRLDEVEYGFFRILEAVSAVGPDDPDTAAILADVTGVEMSPDLQAFVDSLETPVRHAKATTALSSYLGNVFAARPGFLVFEDLHWADDVSLAVIDEVMGLTEDAAVGLVVAMRPYRTEPTWHIHEVAQRDHPHRYHPIELGPLPETDSQALLDGLLAGSAVTPDLRGRVLARADGNPLFLEEMVRSLHDEGTDVAVPGTLESLLVARLDRLGDEARYVVQLASVVGAEFDRLVIRALVDGDEVDHVIVDLLRRGIFVERGGGLLGFRHALLQETAQATILKRIRRELHRRVAAYLLDVTPDAAESIALHLVAAGDEEAAFPHLVESASRAIRSMGLADAVRHLETAIDHTPVDADPAMIVTAHQLLGEAYALIPDLPQAAATYQRLYDYGEEAAHPQARVTALNRLGYATATLGFDLESAGRYLEQARVLAEESGDELGLAEYHMNACFVASMSGDLSEALEHDEETVALGEKSGVETIRLSGMIRRAINTTGMLEIEDATDAVEKALEVGRQLGNTEGVAITEAFGAAMLRWAAGDVRGALELAEAAQPVFHRFRSFYVSMGHLITAGHLFDLGEPENALSTIAEARRAATSAGHLFVLGPALAGMAHAYALLGMPDSAHEFAQLSLQQSDAPMNAFVQSTGWSHLGWAFHHMGEHEAAIGHFTRGLGVSSVTQYYERPRMLTGRSLSRVRTGDVEGAGADVETARTFVVERGVHMADALIARAGGEVATALGDHATAADALAEALRVALDGGRRLESLQTLIARARLEVETGVDPRMTMVAAAEVLETVAGQMTDAELRASFVDKWKAVIGGIAVEPAT